MADITLCVTIPSTWVPISIEAFNAKFPLPKIAAHCSDPQYYSQTECEAAGSTWIPKALQYTQKQWVEYKIREWLRNIIATYKNEKDRKAALEAQNFMPIEDDDVPIDISQ